MQILIFEVNIYILGLDGNITNIQRNLQYETLNKCLQKKESFFSSFSVFTEGYNLIFRKNLCVVEYRKKHRIPAKFCFREMFFFLRWFHTLNSYTIRMVNYLVAIKEYFLICSIFPYLFAQKLYMQSGT